MELNDHKGTIDRLFILPEEELFQNQANGSICSIARFNRKSSGIKEIPATALVFHGSIDYNWKWTLFLSNRTA